MAKNDYVPSKDGQKIPWATNLKTKVATIGPALTLSAQDVIDTQGACDIIVNNINGIEAARQVFEATASDKREQNLAQIRIIRAVAKRAKASATYTNGQGQELGIVGDEQTIDIPNSKPAITVTKKGGLWTIEFDLHGYFDGVNIYKMSPPDEPSFSFLALDTSNPYVDTAAVTNGTSYYAYYVLNGVQVGLQSNVAVVSI